MGPTSFFSPSNGNVAQNSGARRQAFLAQRLLAVGQEAAAPRAVEVDQQRPLSHLTPRPRFGCGYMGVAQNSRARLTQVLVFGSMYQGGHVGTSIGATAICVEVELL